MGIAQHMADMSGERQKPDQMVSKKNACASRWNSVVPQLTGLCSPGFKTIIHRLSRGGGLR
jgi:hypothetical protein